MDAPYKALILDLGGVLIDIDYQATTRAFQALGLHQFEAAYSQFAQNALFDDFEIGKLSPQHFINKLLTALPAGTSPNQVVAAWNAMLGAFPAQKIALLEKLAPQVPLFMLSNTNAIHWTRVEHEWKRASAKSMDSYFQRIFLSHEIGKRKPDQSTFEWVLSEIGFAADEVLFIDDSPQHIEGAKTLGLQTHFYQNEADFYALFS
jgi:putative hydrolase of the HAD superfamily